MGFFSWKTSDTDRSIPSHYSNKPTFTVHMVTEDGQVFTEKDYEGYGVFGGKDFYELVAELNGLPSDRSLGISLCFKDNPSGEHYEGLNLPKFVEEIPKEWSVLPHSPCCEFQGYFYNDTEGYDDY